MQQIDPTDRKPSVQVQVSSKDKLLVGRSEAAQMLSISERALDYLISNKQLTVRRIGTRVLISVAELRRFTKGDHPERLARSSLLEHQTHEGSRQKHRITPISRLRET